MRGKKVLILLTICTTLLVLLGTPVPSLAQDYSFSLDQETADVWINRDGSIAIEYYFTFTCDSGAHPIDAVDVGLPNSNYSRSDIRADVGGKPVQRIDSDYQGEGSDGVAVWLGGATINPGQTGTVHVVIDRVGRMVYQDSQDTNYASTEFSPVWFGSAYTHGSTDMTVRFHLPEGVQPEEPRWHQSPSGWPAEPQTALDDQGRVLYTWHNPSAQPDRQYTFGASFPRQYVDASAIQTGPSPLEQLFTGITTCAGGICCNPVIYIVGFFVGIIVLSAWSSSRRRMQYLPPSMKVEGVGIKRGLTAVEAAVLLETPLNKVMTMILFGLLKKGAVTVLSDNPLKIQASQPLPEGLQSYETTFLEAAKPDGTLGQKELRDMTVALIKAVNNKMKGFSRKETLAYYRDIVQRAWQQVETAETPEVKSQRFDENLEWTMLDDRFDRRTQQTFSTGPVFVPLWLGYHRPLASAYGISAPARAGSSGRSSGGTPSMGRVQLPQLPGSSFAAGIVGGVTGTASRIIGNLTGFTSGVTQVTNPVPKTSSSGRSYGGGGHSCACACACAGCACACAGGGR
jgi:hypothetical protein